MTFLGRSGCALLSGFGICVSLLGACGSEDGRPGSLVSGGGDSGRTGQGGGSSGHAAGGLSAGEGGSSGDAEGGAAGEAVEVVTPTTPFAVFPHTLPVPASCGADIPETTFVIQNGGSMPLTITSATADSGYVVTGTFPLGIAPGAGQALIVKPPAPAANAKLGDESQGTLTFVTNEPGTPTRAIALETVLFGGRFELTDHDGVPLTSALPLTFLASAECPDTVKYRVHNTGNLAFKLLGPSFPTHFVGTTAGTGMNVAPDGYVELQVSGESSPDNACGASGQLKFSVQGAFCGAVPTLNVSWPTTGAASCACPVVAP